MTRDKNIFSKIMNTLLVVPQQKHLSSILKKIKMIKILPIFLMFLISISFSLDVVDTAAGATSSSLIFVFFKIIIFTFYVILKKK